MLRFQYYFSLLLLLALVTTSCSGQGQPPPSPTAGPPVGGPFENRDFFFIEMPEEIGPRDTTQGWYSGGQRLVIEGRILQSDGVTPAPDVVLYYYHTDTGGVYSATPELDQRVLRHGSLRGWVKTDAAGRYAIHTVRPGSYPNRETPAHIHPAVLEPGIDIPYYLDDFFFDDDPFLTPAFREDLPNRGGSGILRLRREGDRQVGSRDIILGRNIPNYPGGR